MQNQQDTIETQRVSRINCIKCSKRLDVSHLPSFSSINCPECGAKQIVPAQFGSFILLGRLGSGGMGVIYHGLDAELGRHVALKVMKKSLGENPEFVEAFKHEARAAAALNHRNVVQIYSFGQHDGQPYIVMELVDGGRLDEMIVEEEQLDEVRAIEIHIEVAEGLKAASDVGLVHGDVKPANILFGSNGEAKVVDFGLASFIGQQQEEGGQVWGTPYYIAPEKARRKKVDFRSDIYSLGATLFHALAGQPPFDGATPLDVVLARLNQPAPNIMDLREDLHQQTADMVARMLESTPTMRYPSYPALLYDMRETLNAARMTEPAATKSKLVSSVIPVNGNKRKRGLTIAGIIIAAIVIVGGAIAGHILYQDHKARVAAELAEQTAFQAAQDRGMIAYSQASSLASGISEIAEKMTAPIEKINDIAGSVEDVMPLTAGMSNHVEQIQQASEKAAELMERISDARYGLEMAADSQVAANTVDMLASYIEPLEEASKTAMDALAAIEQKLDTAEAMREKAIRAAEEQREKERKARELARQAEERKRAEEEARQRELREKQEAERVRVETIQKELDLIDEAREANATLIKLRKFDEAADSFSRLLPELSQPETRETHKNIMDAYRAIAGFKRFLVRMIAAEPYPGGWQLGGVNRDIVDANIEDGLKIAIGPAGEMAIPWEKVTVSQFLQIAGYYLGKKTPSASERGSVLLAMALFCYESGDFKRAERCAVLACEADPRLRTEVDRMMPDLLAQ